MSNRTAIITDNIDSKNDVILRYRKNRAIPQGSILSPWLFRQYCGLFGTWLTNQIEKEINSETKLIAYADDHAVVSNAVTRDDAIKRQKDM